MIDTNDEDYEIYEIFKDQFINNMSQMKRGVVDLGSEKNYTTAVNNLFRIFHGLKANCRHFHFEAIIAFADKAEQMLGALREIEGPAQENIIEWFEKAYEQCLQWQEEMQGEVETFSLANPWLFEVGHIEAGRESLASILKKRSVVYFDTNIERSNKLGIEMLFIVKSFKGAYSFATFERILAEEKPDICIVNVGDNCVRTSILHKQYTPNAAFIAIVDKVDKQSLLKLGLKEIYHILKAQFVFDELYRELLTVTDAHFTSRRCLIDNRKIQNFIATLQPLSITIVRIQEICENPELSIQDLIKVVKQDPIISGQLLRTANNPLFTLRAVNNIDQAVILFGMKQVQAIALSHMVDEFKTVDLSMYHSNENIFSSVATLRLALMVKWYSKVSVADLYSLSITAILGNIGQLLIAREILELGKKEEFLKIASTQMIQFTEEKLIHTTTAFVSSDIVEYWKLEQNIVDAIRFSDHPKDAPKEIADLALANHVVYRLIGLDGKVETTVPEEFKKVLEKRGMKVDSLQKALDDVVALSRK